MQVSTTRYKIWIFDLTTRAARYFVDNLYYDIQLIVKII